jgi:hypothetical protein
VNTGDLILSLFRMEMRVSKGPKKGNTGDEGDEILDET